MTPQERFEHDWCVAEIRKLKAHVLSGTAATPKGTKVDFVVDLFDREDVDSLGPYWLARPFSFDPFVLRGNRAVPSAPTAAYNPAGVAPLGQTVYTEYVSGAVVLGKQRQFSANSQPFTVVPRDVVYHSHGLSSSDMTLEIIFDGPPDSIEVLGDQSAGPPLLDLRSIYSDVISAGIAVAGGPFGLGMVALVRGFSLPAVILPVASTPAMIPAEFMVADSFRTFNLATQKLFDPNVPAFSALDLPSSQTGTTAFTNMNRYLASPLLAGENKIRMQAVGDAYTITLNGTIMYAGSNTLVVERSTVGLASMGVNMLAMLNATVGRTALGIKSFKAWRSDRPEPANETGFGTLKGGVLTYEDRYHIPITDSHNKVVGYTYDPNRN